MKETGKKKKYLITIIFVVIFFLLLVLFISYTCHLNDARREIGINLEQQPKDEFEFYKNIIKTKGTEATKEQDNKTEQTQKKSAAARTQKPEEKLVVEELFDFLTEYGGHTYYVSKKPAAWEQAVGMCAKYGGHLVTITSKEENDALLQAIKLKDFKKDLWIGLTDKDDEGLWKWITGEKLSFTYWDINQPDNWTGHYGGGENYAVIWLNRIARIRYRWNDQTPDSLCYVILEKE